MNMEKTDKKIFIKFDNGEEAFVKFKIEKKTLIVTTTYVPDCQRGKGIAKKLNKELVKIAIERKMKIYPLCNYTEKFLKREKLFHLISNIY